jgi:hypothetical protein
LAGDVARAILAVLLLLTAACAAEPRSGAPVAAQATPEATAIVAADRSPAPVSTPVAMPAPTAPPATAAAPVTAPAPPPAAPALSVSVTPGGTVSTITVTISGLTAVAHAVHLHTGCNGSATAHILTIGTVGSAGTLSVTVSNRLLGTTVIVYPDASAVGRPILCALAA